MSAHRGVRLVELQKHSDFASRCRLRFFSQELDGAQEELISADGLLFFPLPAMTDPGGNSSLGFHSKLSTAFTAESGSPRWKSTRPKWQKQSQWGFRQTNRRVKEWQNTHFSNKPDRPQSPINFATGAKLPWTAKRLPPYSYCSSLRVRDTDALSSTAHTNKDKLKCCSTDSTDSWSPYHRFLPDIYHQSNRIY